MAQGSSVPQFGAWGSGESAPNYTIIFNQAREDRVTGKKINPNEPQQNQHMFPNTTETRVEPEPIRKGVENTGRRAAAGDQSPRHRHGARGGGSGGRHVRQNNAESQHSGDRSPRHPSKTKSSNRGDETPDGSTVVPKFGEWDETKPETGDNFTGIFKRLQEEKQNGLGKSPGHVITPSSSYPTKRNLNTDDSAKCPCFPWCRK